MPIVSEATLRERARTFFQAELTKSLEVAFLYPTDRTFDKDVEVSWLISRTADLRASLASQSFSADIKVDAAELLDSSNPNYAAPISDQMRYACNLILRAKIENSRILKAQLEGDYQSTGATDPWYAGLTATGLPPLPGEKSEPVSSPTLGEITDKFVASKIKHDWAAKTAADVKRVIKLACALIGDQKPMSSVNTDDVKNFRDALAALPPNYMKLALKKGTSPQEAIESNSGGACLSLKTQDKYFTMFRQIFIWAAAEEHIDKVPGANIKVAGIKTVIDGEQREPYSEAQLTKLVHSPLYSGHQSEKCRYKPGKLLRRDGYFWVPLIALHSGLRMGEILQLRKSDLKQENGIWFFDVNKAEDKKLKTHSSKRKVPVHQALIELGLLDQMHSVPPASRLFPEIKKGSDGYYSHNFSKWWGRFARHMGFASPKTAFHSLRHNFIQALREAGQLEYVNKALAGHADKSVHAQYGSAVPLTILKAAIDTVDFKLNFSHLQP
ncbi:site-specific integrase [Tardiphaga sp. 11_C7_N12_6]|uniref:site-specific integrase n=1 Tax=Tardiphaga sp. 11_C7_N12_6 TaxID=3240789 RepID=UPI003F203708